MSLWFNTPTTFLSPYSFTIVETDLVGVGPSFKRVLLTGTAIGIALGVLKILLPGSTSRDSDLFVWDVAYVLRFILVVFPYVFIISPSCHLQMQ